MSTDESKLLSERLQGESAESSTAYTRRLILALRGAADAVARLERELDESWKQLGEAWNQLGKERDALVLPRHRQGPRAAAGEEVLSADESKPLSHALNLWGEELAEAGNPLWCRLLDYHYAAARLEREHDAAIRERDEARRERDTVLVAAQCHSANHDEALRLLEAERKERDGARAALEAAQQGCGDAIHFVNNRHLFCKPDDTPAFGGTVGSWLAALEADARKGHEAARKVLTGRAQEEAGRE